VNKEEEAGNGAKGRMGYDGKGKMGKELRMG